MKRIDLFGAIFLLWQPVFGQENATVTLCPDLTPYDCVSLILFFFRIHVTYPKSKTKISSSKSNSDVLDPPLTMLELDTYNVYIDRVPYFH